jgi:hypothetical protein
MLHAEIAATTQWTRVRNTYAKEATSYYQTSHAINQLSRHRRQPMSEGITVMDKLNRWRAK